MDHSLYKQRTKKTKMARKKRKSKKSASPKEKEKKHRKKQKKSKQKQDDEDKDNRQMRALMVIQNLCNSMFIKEHYYGIKAVRDGINHSLETGNPEAMRHWKRLCEDLDFQGVVSCFEVRVDNTIGRAMVEPVAEAALKSAIEHVERHYPEAHALQEARV